MQGPRAIAVGSIAGSIAGAAAAILLLAASPTDGSPAGPPLALQPKVVRADLLPDERNTIEVFQAASPSVVFIQNKALRRDVFTLNVLEIPQGTGTGFVWDDSGHVVTNFHVIMGASALSVTLTDRTTYEAEVVGVEPDKDLAVLKVRAPAGKLRPLRVGTSTDLAVGQKVLAIGNPFGLDQTLTTGVVSALGREIKSKTNRTIMDVIQTDAAINPGNSGGPLLDSGGRIIGVNTAIVSPSGSSAGIGFAVPVESVKRVVPQLIRHGRVIRPGLGVEIANERVARRLGVDGLIVVSVQPNSAAARAGVKGVQVNLAGEPALGDVILAVEGQAVRNYDELTNALDKHAVGDTIQLRVLRDGRPVDIQVKLQRIE